MKIFFVSLMILVTVSIGMAKELTVEDVIKNHSVSSEGLKDLKAQASLVLKATVGYFPYTENLTGNYYYQKPDRHKLEFSQAPSYLKKAPSMFNWKLPSEQNHRAKLKGPFDRLGLNVYEILFIPTNAESSKLSVSCVFDAKSFRMTEQVTSYRDGGSVALTFTYEDKKLPILDKVHALVKLPSYKLDGTAIIDLSKQKSKEGLEDSIFE